MYDYQRARRRRRRRLRLRADELAASFITHRRRCKIGHGCADAARLMIFSAPSRYQRLIFDEEERRLADR